MDSDKTTAVPVPQEEGCTALITADKQEQIRLAIVDLYNRSGMTLTQLSRLTYISERTIHRYLTGNTKDPHFFTICTIIIVLGGDVNEILGIPSVPSADASAPPAESSQPYGNLLKSMLDEISALTTTVHSLTHPPRLKTALKIAGRVLEVLIVALLLIVEIVDLSQPDWGRYQWAIEMSQHFLRRIL